MIDVVPHIASLRAWVEAQGFAGWDPYDALNSPVSCVLALGTKQGRMAWTQFFRRSPINLRLLFAVPKRLNAKGLGLFLEAYSELWEQEGEDEIGKAGMLKSDSTTGEGGSQKAVGSGQKSVVGGQKGGDHRLLSIIEILIEKLEVLRSVGCTGAAWGYPFDWQHRAAFVPEGTPTIVNTAFIGHALLDCYERTGMERARELALEVPMFLLDDLRRSAERGPFCFSYTPLDCNFVHNANLLGASLLFRLGHHTKNTSWTETARSSMTYSLERQRPDGSWPYAETSFQSWVDSFHTGYNLEALRWFTRLGEQGSVTEAYRRGVEFYARNFFLEDGTPKYYHDRVYPIDIHSPAEAVCFFSGEGAAYHELTDRVLSWMLRNLWGERKGYFYFRKSRFGTNRIPYMRWSQAWGMRALVEYHVHRNE